MSKIKKSNIIWEWDLGKFGYYAIKEKNKYSLYANGCTHATRISNCSFLDKDKVYEYFTNQVTRKENNE